MSNFTFTKKLIKKTSKLLFVIILITSFSSCATIFGGSRYVAKVHVPEHPDAKIEYEGRYIGTGEATVKVKRKNANNFKVNISKEGCRDETKRFYERSFRGWAFVGSLVTFTTFTPLPIPWGVALDAALGAWWKPDVEEKGVLKQDINNYYYRIDYLGCVDVDPKNIPSKKTDQILVKSKAERLRELKELYEEGILTKEEFDSEKRKILDEN